LWAISDDEIDEALAGQMANAPAEVLGFTSEEVGLETEEKELYAIYHENGLQALWVTHRGPGKHAKTLFEAITDAESDGLDPAAYQLSGLQHYWKSKHADDLASLDILLTLALVAWVNDVSVGRVHPKSAQSDQFTHAGDRRGDAVAITHNYLEADKPGEYLASLLPQHHYYRGLKTALARYRAIAANGGWPTIAETGSTLHPGDQDERVPQIRKRLAVTGELTDKELNSDLYNETLQTAVEKFQLFHGLTPDGLAGAQTISQMNVSVDYRIRQIEMNLERWRWLDHDLGSSYILVDIASFDVQGVIDDKAAIEMRAIVGKAHHETPLFSDHIKYIEFNPFWNLTPSIARHETVPKIRKDPDYLAKNHIRVFDGWGQNAKELNPKDVNWNKVTNPGKYKFRQDPGPWNALGTMKFIFPNEYSVYLHDTPNHALFNKAERDFSHGCIRLSEPSQLAAWVLSQDGSDWDPARIEDVLKSQKRTVKNLNTPLAVHLTYETAWIDGDSRLRFAQDVYGRDKQLEKILYKAQ
jgi:murein L,D-transpeptidase YcbB/YkuD